MLDRNKIFIYTNDKVCRVTGKKMYFHEDAKKESKYMRGRFDSNHAPYRCGHCTYFHVGSTASRRQSSRRQRSDQ